MNSTVFTTRPTMSTIEVSANVDTNSQMLDELLTESKEERQSWLQARLKASSRWFTQSSCLGVDDNDNLMYSLTRSETTLLITGAITGLILLVSLLNWLIG